MGSPLGRCRLFFRRKIDWWSFRPCAPVSLRHGGPAAKSQQRVVSPVFAPYAVVMANPNSPTPALAPQVASLVNALYEAQGNAVDNLADVVADPELVQACAADVAALAVLLRDDGTGRSAIAAYL